MIHVKQHLDKLGLRVKDKVTGYTGVVTSVAFDLYGCIVALVNPGTDETGKIKDSQWFDINRLEVLDPEPVMERPNFDFGPVAEGKKGAAEKPAFGKA
jgi:hypothetical protein